ncbi:hypothetical protein ISCGN_001107 [Ixodes scapularis]
MISVNDNRTFVSRADGYIFRFKRPILASDSKSAIEACDASWEHGRDRDVRLLSTAKGWRDYERRHGRGFCVFQSRISEWRRTAQLHDDRRDVFISALVVRGAFRHDL